MIAAPTVTFIPCCNRGEGIIFIDTVPLLSTNLVDGATYRYTGGPATGQGLGPLGIDTLVSGQCYTLVFGVSPSIYPILPTFIIPSIFVSTGNSCLHPDCPECSPELPFTNRYLQFVPCCDEDDIILFRLPPSNIPNTGIAIYAGGVSGSPYVSTDAFGNLSTPLFSNLCYSITNQFAGPGSSITNATEYNNLQIAPAEIAGNYSYLSTVNTDCFDFSAECPSCNPLCFTLWSCDGITSSQPLFTTSTDLTAFVGTNIVVSSLDPDDNIVEICVFVQNTTEFNCTNAIEVVVDSESCECDCTCYTIIGEIKSVEWIDCFGVYNLVATPLSPFEICAGAYPLALPLVPNNPLQVINNGLCIESTIFNDETCEEETEFNCEPACYLLEDCLDNTNVIYSNSTSLLGPANLGQIVTIAGYTECWKILIPESCDCPINVTVTQVHNCCEACLPNINYKLTSCKDSTAFSYTSDDLSLYVDRVIRREDCPEECWIVSEIDGNIPTDTPIVVLEDYLDCEKCYRKYYLLEDCLGLQNDIITYTDLSLYVDKVITLDWCPETCWEVSETLEDEGAGIISDILNTYNLCIDCLTNAPCICSTIKNYNTISQIYKYLDCYGLLQSVTLLPNQKSNRLCLIRWYAPEPCDELIVTITSSTGVVSNITVYQNSVNHPGPVIVNDKPTWKDAGNNLYIYYDGTKWILSKNFTPLVLPPVYTTIGFINCNGDCDCPTGTWEQSSSIPNQDVYVTTELKYTIEYFGNCINGVCPPVKNKQKSVKPGYNTPGCEAWKYEEISCRAAEAMYKQVLQLRYGISNCCPEEDEQYIVQKELIDLAALYDPAYPCATNSCGCNNNCNCSTVEPVCPPIPLTYNCFCTQSACECIEIGNGSGEYSSLALCQAACVPTPPVTSYNCTNGSCVLVSGPSGTYPTLTACQANCQPITSYNCTDGTCVLVSGSGGQYPTLLACQAACIPITSWNCLDCECVSVSGSGGTYPTEIDCLESTCTDSFITTWQTTEATESIALPYLNSGTYTGTINWGDGNTTANTYGNRVHIYATAGIYTVTICGDVIGWNFALVPNSKLNIRTVVQWGQLQLGGNGSYFLGCSNLDLSLVSDILDLTGITNMFGMFSLCTSLTTINNINSWNTSAITNMTGMFSDCTLFNQALSFNTSAVTNMFGMFYGCTAFNSLLNFNTGLVADMTQMFMFCFNFNQPLTFNTSAVINMSSMFNGATSFNQPLSFNTGAVINMNSMFVNCYAFNQPLTWDTISVIDMGGLFAGCTLFNGTLTFTSTANVQLMNSMFANALAFQQYIGSWDISSVTDFIDFMNGKTPATWPTTYFDNLLCGWSPQTVVPSLTIDFGTASYTNATGGPCRTVLQSPPNLWTINSGPGV